MAVSDYQAGKVVANLPVGAGVDAAAFDPATGYAFASAGQSGNVTIIHQDSPDAYHVLETVTTALASRNMGLDPVTHRIYMAAAKFDAAPAGGRGRGPMIAGSFSVLVIERSASTETRR